jgi:hypothetical protein
MYTAKKADVIRKFRVKPFSGHEGAPMLDEVCD